MGSQSTGGRKPPRTPGLGKLQAAATRSQQQIASVAAKVDVILDGQAKQCTVLKHMAKTLVLSTQTVAQLSMQFASLPMGQSGMGVHMGGRMLRQQQQQLQGSGWPVASEPMGPLPGPPLAGSIPFGNAVTLMAEAQQLAQAAASLDAPASKPPAKQQQQQQQQQQQAGKGRGGGRGRNQPKQQQQRGGAKTPAAPGTAAGRPSKSAIKRDKERRRWELAGEERAAQRAAAALLAAAPGEQGGAGGSGELAAAVAVAAAAKPTMPAVPPNAAVAAKARAAAKNQAAPPKPAGRGGAAT